MNKRIHILLVLAVLSGCGLGEEQANPWSVVKVEPSWKAAPLAAQPEGKPTEQAAPQQHETLQDIQKANTECENMAKQGIIKTFVAYYECTTSAMNQLCSAEGACQYPDLERLRGAKQLEMAERLDEKKITLAEANVEYAQINSDIIAEAHKRMTITKR